MEAELCHLGELAEQEVERIESKYSRYRADSLLSRINNAEGAVCAIDAETFALMQYADQCWRLSDGFFDITSGVLRRAWTFDGSDNIPASDQIDALLPYIGWDKVTLSPDSIALQPGMEIDFGGLGKEYAVDRVVLILAEATEHPFLINFGGDLRVSGPRADGGPWRIAIEAIQDGDANPGMLKISGGAIATSGDARRFLLKHGVRYSHILDPKTGWPVSNPPRSVTIAASTCMEAGILSTLAMGMGTVAEEFLKRERVPAWVMR